MPRPRLHLDYETFCTYDITVVGAEIYSTKAFPFIVGMKLDDDPVVIEDFVESYNEGFDDFGEFDPDYAPPMPELLREAVKDKWHIVAHNAPFEYNITANSPACVLWEKPTIDQMICTAAKSRYYGFPSSLDKVGAALNLATQKSKRGKALIDKFCKPQKVSRKRGAKATYIKRINPLDPEWIEFRDVYNRDDVLTEHGVDCALPDIPEKYARWFYMDMAMNLRGFPVDIAGVRRARDFYEHFYKELEARFREICDGVNPTQVAVIRKTLNERYGCDLGDLQAATIRDKLLEDDLHPMAREALVIRAEAAKASVKKLEAFEDRTGADGRARGGFMWYGAHTGRWSGRGIQPQNFPRGVKSALRMLPAFFSWLESGEGAATKAELETAGLVYPSPLTVLSAALRGFIRAEPGKLFVAVDYSQIELRVLAWLAGEEELLELLRSGHDPYIHFAAKYMYDVDPSTISKEDVRRQIAKSALLGAQYQIWIWAFIEYCKATANLKITIEEATNAILSYRSANPNIVDFWSDIERAAIYTVETKGEAKLNNLRLRYEELGNVSWLRIYLPNGRPISYPYPEVSIRATEREKRDKDGNIVIDENGVPVTYTQRKKVLSFMTEYNGQWVREYTYGGKTTENVVQGIAAEIMAEGMYVAELEGFAPIATVHDENVTEIDDPGSEPAREAALKKLIGLVCQLPS
jgi:DNA polymerase